MTGTKDVEESSKDKRESVDDGSVAKVDELSESHLMKEVDMSGENCKDSREEGCGRRGGQRRGGRRG